MVNRLPTDPDITIELVSEHGLSVDEYARIQLILGREPTYTELGIFSVMWSEHCSYKNSRTQLRKFPTTGPAILVKAGEENAGVVDIGDGWAVAFKVESHNHPSAVEPFQGAATGVGGILRDIFTMGARPVINMNSLRFGQPNNATVRHQVDGVVGGIAFYGNCMGIPTIGGDVYFDDTYATNCLVNAFSLGIMRKDDIKRGRATGVGNPVFYVGAATGRDGIHGATFASVELTKESESKRSSVQVADPFMEKLLLEACLELFTTDYVVGTQDMGAAGLTCSTCETACRGGSGIEIDAALVPQREHNMVPYEIMLSESQERMLIIVRKGCEDKVQDIFHKWDLHAVRIGEVTDDGIMRVKWHGTSVAEIPARTIAEDAPLYTPVRQKPGYLAKTEIWTPAKIVQPKDYTRVLRILLSEPTIASKKAIYRRYDHMVRTGAVVLPGSDAAVFWLKEADKFLALSADCNSRYVYLNPRMGGRTAVAESARNVVCAGGQPLAITDCLNFGNPNKPEIYWQFCEAIDGMVEACTALGTPVTGGNVSFYNENPDGAINPTPLVVMVGQIARKEDITTQWFKQAGDAVWLLDGTQKDALHGLGGSEYLLRFHRLVSGAAPVMELDKEKALQACCLEAIRAGIVHSAHDCAEGGLAVALAECCMSAPNDGLRSAARNSGAEIDVTELAPLVPRMDALLFGEAQSRIVVSVGPKDEKKLASLVSMHGIKAYRLGRVGGLRLAISANKTVVIDEAVAVLEEAWESGLPKCLNIQMPPSAKEPPPPPLDPLVEVLAPVIAVEQHKGVSDEYQDRKAGLVFFGIVSILIGVVLAALLPVMPMAVTEHGYRNSIKTVDMGLFCVSAMPQVMLALCFVWMGVGSILARRWARALILVLAWWWLAAGMLVMGYWLAFGSAAMTQSLQAAASMGSLVITLTTVFIGFIFLIVPCVFILFYRSLHVLATCAARDTMMHWTDTCPVQVLGLIVPFAFAATWMPMLLVSDCTFPCGSKVLTGVHGGACIALVFVLLILIPIGLHRMSKVAWWAALGLTAFLGASWMSFASNAVVLRVYEYFGISNQEMQIARQPIVIEGTPLLILILVPVLVLIVYVIRIRRHFEQYR